MRNRPDLAQEVGTMLDDALASARQIIDSKSQAVEAIARHLLAHEYASAEQITTLMANAQKAEHREVTQSKRRAL